MNLRLAGWGGCLFFLREIIVYMYRYSSLAHRYMYARSPLAGIEQPIKAFFVQESDTLLGRFSGCSMRSTNTHDSVEILDLLYYIDTCAVPCTLKFKLDIQ